MTHFRRRAIGVSQWVLHFLKAGAKRLPGPILRYLKRAAANRRDRDTINALAPLNALAVWAVPACALCNKRDVASHVIKNGYRIVRCRNDGLLFVSPRPADPSVFYDSRYYDGGVPGVYASYEAHTASMEQEWSRRLSLLRELSPDGQRLLDVGAATGGFLALARDHGWQGRGIDLSEYAAAEARNLRGLDVIAGSLPNSAFEAGTFDVVTMWDCIEHLSDPGSVVQSIQSLLKPGGILALSTGEIPHEDSRAASGWYYPPWHLYYFSQQTITALLRSAGFELVDISVQDVHSPYAIMTVLART
jgi:2-polyprenyl-3-methyl-5-hydroxy-6-metoxy-1,4-benzoquinol methylase